MELQRILCSFSDAHLETFRLQGHFFEGKECEVLARVLKSLRAQPLPTKAQIALGLDAAALELELGQDGVDELASDAKLLWEQWRLRKFASRGRRFLLGPLLEDEEMRQMRARIKQLKKELRAPLAAPISTADADAVMQALDASTMEQLPWPSVGVPGSSAEGFAGPAHSAGGFAGPPGVEATPEEKRTPEYVDPDVTPQYAEENALAPAAAEDQQTGALQSEGNIMPPPAEEGTNEGASQSAGHALDEGNKDGEASQSAGHAADEGNNEASQSAGHSVAPPPPPPVDEGEDEVGPEDEGDQQEEEDKKWTPSGAGADYREFLAACDVERLPQRCRYPAGRALWHEHKGNCKLCARALNDALIKGGLQPLEGELQQGMVKEHLDRIPSAGGPVRRLCPRCRKPIGSCAPSCERRRQEPEAKRQAKRDARQQAA